MMELMLENHKDGKWMIVAQDVKWRVRYLECLNLHALLPQSKRSILM
jgi:hypothetical protein